ncbi:potassium channel [Aureococcus anophagefferens]|nr:potassium channel [Aureococcus anophagefferens]
MLLLKFARLKQRDVDHGVDPELTEADYIVRTLLNGQFVDPQLLVAIQRAFYWTARGDGERSTISVDDVHEEHRAEARRRSLTVEHLNFVGEKLFTASGHSLRDLRQYARRTTRTSSAGAATTGTPRSRRSASEADDGDDGRASRRILAKDRFLRPLSAEKRAAAAACLRRRSRREDQRGRARACGRRGGDVAAALPASRRSSRARARGSCGASAGPAFTR